MPNVLLITYMFPPAGGIGVPRALGYVRYLPRQGCRLSVLAPTNPALRDTDPQLGTMVPEDVAVYRAWNPELPMSVRDRISKKTKHYGEDRANPTTIPPRSMRTGLRQLAHHVFFPDPQVVWLPWAYRKAHGIIEREATDTIIVNMPPFSLLKLALALKRCFPHLKIILDFRDEWVGYYLRQIDRPTEEKIQRALELEAEAVRASTYVSTVTETWRDQLRSRYPGEPASKFIYTPNGYDPKMFRDFAPRQRSDAQMVVTYFGTIHDNSIYSPDNYLRVIETLPDDIHNHIETRFIGRIVGNPQNSLKRTRAKIRLLGFMPKLQGIHHLQETDFTLLIATNPGSHAGKLFDYLGCGKPILALSPPGGEIDRLLQRTRSGWCANPWDKAEIREMLISAYWRLKQGSAIINPDQNAVQAYSWPNIFHNFAIATGISPAQSVNLGHDPRRPEPMKVGA